MTTAATTTTTTVAVARRRPPYRRRSAPRLRGRRTRLHRRRLGPPRHDLRLAASALLRRRRHVRDQRIPRRLDRLLQLREWLRREHPETHLGGLPVAGHLAAVSSMRG